MGNRTGVITVPATASYVQLRIVLQAQLEILFVDNVKVKTSSITDWDYPGYADPNNTGISDLILEK